MTSQHKLVDWMMRMSRLKAWKLSLCEESQEMSIWKTSFLKRSLGKNFEIFVICNYLVVRRAECRGKYFFQFITSIFLRLGGGLPCLVNIHISIDISSWSYYLWNVLAIARNSIALKNRDNFKFTCWQSFLSCLRRFKARNFSELLNLFGRFEELIEKFTVNEANSWVNLVFKEKFKTT